MGNNATSQCASMFKLCEHHAKEQTDPIDDKIDIKRIRHDSSGTMIDIPDELPHTTAHLGLMRHADSLDIADSLEEVKTIPNRIRTLPRRNHNWPTNDDINIPPASSNSSLSFIAIKYIDINGKEYTDRKSVV